MIGVVVCDDHGIVRSGIRRILAGTDDIRVLGAASTGAELLALVAEHRPDVAVVDIRLADGSGLDLLGPVARIRPDTRVVMLSMYGARGYVEKARALGARGYVTKECLEDELIGAVRRVMEDPDFVSFRPVGQRSSGARRGATDALSAREVEVLALLASGMTNAEIADQLFLSSRTVESHRGALQRKLGVRSRAELARVARDVGLTA
ncbi:response regulator transcription factor [Pseudonocardia sp. KRD-184]|uniref:Response regulator transcription factor n=1 Tax=Pseudonocardia oceani TaxID=2792013 RepID=A0ABS6U2D1_9PSEU|nr:response regulator transcription factor [Pseudonocardia oceani]MBW0088141.1 response regulator transcription factor [Pseudonocardia oceani]MBW0095092.1 response regulator transcription factor [Pseudonocardia oceani]MBW0107171.1 response regulator transcription factor [Pseudonocardia oceani]MBW0119733.1 response regulator transcription factor [Pseudonocardia oceani]MBW0126396.1 response regulator transcription factor [Pseudonocardia oceani]